MLDKDDLGTTTVPVLTDFGQVVSQASQTFFTEKSDIMAPEQWEGHVGKASDMYAIGIITYELITGQAPFQGNSKEELKNQHATGRRPKVKERAPHLAYPPALDQLFEEVLDRDPQRRNNTFPSATHFYNRFEGILIQPPVAAHNPAINSVQSMVQILDQPANLDLVSNATTSARPVAASSTIQPPFPVAPGSVQVSQAPLTANLKVAVPNANGASAQTRQLQSNKTNKKWNFLLSNWIGIGFILFLVVAATIFPFSSNSLSTTIHDQPVSVALIKELSNNTAAISAVAVSQMAKP